jgi:hypothetical protein
MSEVLTVVKDETLSDEDYGEYVLKRRIEDIEQDIGAQIAEMDRYERSAINCRDQIASLRRAGKTFERVTNGLDLSDIDFGEGMPPVRVTAEVARYAVKNTATILAPRERPYKEFGTIEGLNRGVFRDAKGRRILHITHRMTGKRIRCVLGGAALDKIEEHLIGEVLRGRRVRVIGLIYYTDLGKVGHVEAVDLEFPRPRAELPNADEIVDENFTGGLPTQEYLERLRNGSLN